MKRKEKDVPSALMWRPQHGSCSSQKEEREIEQINTDHQNLPLHLLLHPCPYELMFECGMQRGCVQIYACTVLLVLRCQMCTHEFAQNGNGLLWVSLRRRFKRHFPSLYNPSPHFETFRQLYESIPHPHS